jgi:large subunit ribosomal protein L25
MVTMRINAKIRTKTGKGPARKIRSVGKLPAIFYGPEINPIMLSVDYMQLEKMLKGKSAENIIFDLRIDSDEKGRSKKVMIKELQRDPVTREYLHVDLYEIAMGKEIEADIPVHLINIPIGVTNGGILETIKRELKVLCMPKNLVDRIDIDVSDIDIGQSVHVKDISFPQGLKSIEDENLTIAIVNAPTITAEEEEVKEEEVEEAESEEIKGEDKS